MNCVLQCQVSTFIYLYYIYIYQYIYLSFYLYSTFIHTYINISIYLFICMYFYFLTSSPTILLFFVFRSFQYTLPKRRYVYVHCIVIIIIKFSRLQTKTTNLKMFFFCIICFFCLFFVVVLSFKTQKERNLL